MYDFIEGEIDSKSPAHVSINCNGLGYYINISLYTYDYVKSLNRCRLLLHLAVKEDSHTLFGFYTPEERTLFQHLIAVNGVGTNTARMILSALPPNDLITAIINGNVALLKSIKGIGPKSAQRIILELQDKLGKKRADNQMVESAGSSDYEQAAEALCALGFGRASVDRALLKVSKDLGDNATVESLVKNSLKVL